MKDIIGLLLAILILFGGCRNTSDPAAEETADLAFQYGETEIRMHADAAPILRNLGEPVSYTEQTSCAFEGLDKTYCFGGFYLQTYPDENTDRVFSLWFADDSVATKEGIRIGEAADLVESIYGSSAIKESGGYVITDHDSRLMIAIQDGCVTSVQYEAIF